MSTDIDNLIADARERAHAYTGGPEADRLWGLADALEAASSEADELRRRNAELEAELNQNAHEATHAEQQMWEARDQRDALAAVIEKAYEVVDGFYPPLEARAILATADPAAVLRERDAEKWDEGARAREEALERWFEPTSTERMYWPDSKNPYRGEA